ncbi:3'-5' exonuclease family protein [Legionella bononiensis]|uniref:Excinuclease cho n=1 Tax=Legionella bononiensis TaxID=2793102 RepID=A0ABS1WDV7_9GAMM|nr:3'-5' exonuclease family protein [Legionella bononiensis]MBL7527542.1 GIY-YIG nuclease family protein [Legionella bononiensis]
MQYSFQWALVDIETTGLHVTTDGITEIAVMVITEHGIRRTWHRLIKPKRSIPDAIKALTGISNEMVQDAPYFEDIALELLDVLHECVFVAHNARFDFGFIKNAFKRCGITYQAPVLCTIKLLKQLYPNQRHYNLEFITQSLNVSLEHHHRAQGDVAALHEVIQKMVELHTWSKILFAAKALYHKSSIPSKLTTDVSQLPDTPGVYIFYGDKNPLPLYIGKSITLRQRVLSHFSGDYTHAKEFTLSQQVVRIEVIPTAGELSALLLESKMIKEHMPVYNRRLRRKTTIAGFKLSEHQGYLTLSIVREQVEEEHELKQHGIYGAFRSVAAAKRTLLQLIKNHDLCQKLCGVEQGNGSCFSYQLKRCHGACIKEEPHEVYNKRLLEALEEYQEVVWPFKGAIAVKEHCPVNKITQFTVVHQWRHVCSVNSEHLLTQWRSLLDAASESSHTYDDYKIVLSYLKHQRDNVQIIELE